MRYITNNELRYLNEKKYTMYFILIVIFQNFKKFHDFCGIIATLI